MEFMPARLFCKTGELAGAEFRIGEEDADIGRDASNQIPVSGSAVSGRHARISFDSKLRAYFLEPLEGGGTTWLDGARLGRKVRLSKLHVITLGGVHDFVFQQVEAPPKRKVADTHSSIERGIELPDLAEDQAPAGEAGAPKASETVVATVKGLEVPSFQEQEEASTEEPSSPTDTMAEIPRKVVLPSFDQAGPADSAAEAGPAAAEPRRLHLQLDSEEGPVRHPLEDGEFVVGRGADSDIQIVDFSLSRKHAALRVEAGRVWVRDLDSVNHTFVDDDQIEKEVELAPGVKVRFGLVEGTIEPSE